MLNFILNRPLMCRALMEKAIEVTQVRYKAVCNNVKNIFSIALVLDNFE